MNSSNFKAIIKTSDRIQGIIAGCNQNFPGSIGDYGKIDRPYPVTAGNLAEFLANGNLKDSGIAASNLPIPLQKAIEGEQEEVYMDPISKILYTKKIGTGTSLIAGLVKSSDKQNYIFIHDDATMEINSLGVNKLENVDGVQLILDGDAYI